MDFWGDLELCRIEGAGEVAIPREGIVRHDHVFGVWIRTWRFCEASNISDQQLPSVFCFPATPTKLRSSTILEPQVEGISCFLSDRPTNIQTRFSI